MLWLFALLWPLLGIKPEGLEFADSFAIWSTLALASAILLAFWQLKQHGVFDFVSRPAEAVSTVFSKATGRVPSWIWLVLVLAGALVFPLLTERYAQDVAISVLVYICLGLGLNVVVGMAGLLDLGYIAFYGVGAYTYALLSVHFGLSFWLSLPIAGAFSACAGCIIGYPTLRMRGDYLAIVTLGFGEIVRIVLNNWMSLTNGPNGILGIKPPGAYWWSDGKIEHIWLGSLEQFYYVILALAVCTVVAVYRLNHSRIGRAFEAVREDQTAAELMGVNTLGIKLLAYSLGAIFGGLAGAFFAARMRFVSPESFTFIESAMVLAMVVLGGMG
ncbi:MAG: branched-chain amino acid ABC transporter permease, partial [Humidesulfovibrio sp.]|nr:branched-chain amino acid ABC transporter permease [Humidesulfovibrio sp.]